MPMHPPTPSPFLSSLGPGPLPQSPRAQARLSLVSLRTGSTLLAVLRPLTHLPHLRQRTRPRLVCGSICRPVRSLGLVGVVVVRLLLGLFLVLGRWSPLGLGPERCRRITGTTGLIRRRGGRYLSPCWRFCVLGPLGLDWEFLQ